MRLHNPNITSQIKLIIIFVIILLTFAIKEIMSLQLKINSPETLPDAVGKTREQFKQEAKWAKVIQ